MSNNIELTSEEKAVLIPKVQSYCEAELSVEVGRFDAEFLLDFFINELGVPLYNKGLRDGLDAVKLQVQNLCDELSYSLEK